MSTLAIKRDSCKARIATIHPEKHYERPIPLASRWQPYSSKDMLKGVGPPGITARIRSAIAEADFAGAERLLRKYRHEHGATPKALEALSWMARGSLAARRLAKAAEYARTAHRYVVRQLKTIELDAEPALVSALG